MAIGKEISIFKRILKLDILQELFLAAAGCFFVIILFHLFPESYHLEAKSRNFKGKIVFSCLILSFFFIFVILNQTNSKINFFKVNFKRNIIIFSIFNFSISYFLFFNADFISYGLAGDNYYRTAFITHMANSGYPQDYCYKGLSAYYFPFYYYCLALYAKVFHVEPYKMLRFGFLFSCYILPIILFESWKQIYNLKKSFFISTLSIILLLDAYTISHIITFILLIPFIVYYYENYTNKDFKKKDYIIAGILGSLLFCTYATYFYIIPIYYSIKLIQNKTEFKESLKRITIISFLIILFSSWYLIPLFLDFMSIGIEVHQNHYLTIQMLDVPIIKEILPLTFSGIISFIGLVFIVKKYSNLRDLKIYGNLLIALYILIFIGFIGVLLNTPFYLYYRFFEIPLYILIISSSLFYIKFCKFLVQNNLFKKSKSRQYIPQIEIFSLIIIIFAQIYYYSQIITSIPQYDMAFSEEVPKDDIEIFEELDYEDKVFLTYKRNIVCYLQIYLFICPYPHFSHPSALHNQRVKFLIELSECESSKEFYDEIMDSDFGPIDYFYLETKDNSTDFHFSTTYDKFLDEQGVDITLKRSLFEDRELFEEINIKGELIYKTIY